MDRLTLDVPGQRRNGREAVQQVVRQNVGRVAQSGQVVDLVPFLNQRRIGQQALDLFVRQAQAQSLHAGTQARLQIHTHACTPSSAVCMKPLKPPFFRWIKSSDTLAGVMPEMREAWPKVSGRCLASFWRASIDKAETCR